MESVQFDRKLVAILYADVADYSRLTAEDEVGTHRTLSTYLDLFTECVQQHGGKVEHYAGDAILAGFPTVSRAVTCGICVQKNLEERNSGLPDDRQVRFRIGVNLGEVIVDRGEIYGEGVNVAARLESLAEPGGICISEAVRTALGTKLPLEYEFLGERDVKNIKEPVRAYRARLKPDALLSPPTPATKAVRPSRYAVGVAVIAALMIGGGVLGWLKPWKVGDAPAPVEREVAQLQGEPTALPFPKEPSIAVLPFENLSGDPEQGYFADGITVDLITDLSRIAGLFVSSRNAVFSYKGTPMKTKVVSRELGVRYVLSGSVRRAGDTLRINVELVDAKTEFPVWAERFDRNLKDVFALQDEIAANIVSALEVQLTDAEHQRIGRRYAPSMEAYELYLRGVERVALRSGEDMLAARELYQKAIEVDPKFARAYAALSITYSVEHSNWWSAESEASLERASDLAREAIALDASLPEAHFAMARVHREKAEHEEAIAAAKKSIELDPNDADGYVMLASIQTYAGRPEEALKLLTKATRLNPPQNARYYFHRGQAYFTLERYHEAIKTLEQGLDRNANSPRLRVWLAAAYAQAGRSDDAHWKADELLLSNPEFSVEWMRRITPFKDRAYLERFVDGLRKAGLPE